MLLKRKQVILIVLELLLVTFAASSFYERPSKQSRQRSMYLANLLRNDTNQLTSPQTDTFTDEEKEVFLRITRPMQDQNATSGDTVFFKCKVNGWPKKNMHYTWYRDDAVIDPDFEPRATISTRPWGSRLRMRDLFTSDSGLYRCEASNGIRRVHTTAFLSVSFELPPPLNKNEKPMINFPRGKCEVYKGATCSEYLSGMKIYVDAFENPKEMDLHLQVALQQIGDTNSVTPKCRRFAIPAFCHFIFTPCQVDNNGDIKRGERLCREDCESLKQDTCYQEYLQRNESKILKKIFNSANCSLLPSSENSECVRVGLVPQEYKKECYRDAGESYRGELNIASSGKSCKRWPKRMALKYPELLGGHNFCRNPGKKLKKPWCFVDKARKVKVTCKVEQCATKISVDAPHADIESIYMTSCASAVVVLVSTLFVFCLCCRGNKKCCASASTKSQALAKASILPLKPTIPIVKSNAVCLVSQLGNGEYGKVYIGRIANNKQHTSTIAVKTLEKKSTTAQLRSFKREMEMLSKMDHPHMTQMQAVIMDKNFGLVFEYAYQDTLKEYLSKNKCCDVINSSGNCRGSSRLTNNDLVNMALQIASGMEYLTSHNFIHRDLAARNILVCGNMELKICNLGVVRDSYLSSYYRSPQGGQMLPIRWMAPESLQSWQFSGKSSVWSFGVLLWEMFSYGLQPYCGYSNHEVLDMISRRQLLTCPDQCPAKVYSLMHECWANDPQLRPNFKVLQIKLQSCSLELPFIVESFSPGSETKMPLIPPCAPPEYTFFPTDHDVSDGRKLQALIPEKEEDLA